MASIRNASKKAWVYGGALGVSGATVYGAYLLIDAKLAAYTGVEPVIVLINFGANDAAGIGTAYTESEWKLRYGYILDAYHTKWPGAQVYVAKAYIRSCTTCDTMAAWIDDVLAPRSAWAHVGLDERGVGGLEWTDAGMTYYGDTKHYADPAGYIRAAQLWQTALGY